MARAETYTLMPLDTWAQVMGINPWEFNQIGTGFPTSNHAQCPNVFMQYEWQQPNFISREEIARVIADAEAAVADELTYWPAPKYIVNEVHPYPNNRVIGGIAVTPYGLWKAVSLNWTKVQGGGLFGRTLLSANKAVARSDNDSDTISDKFTVTVATTITDPNEIAIYFKSADRGGADIAETWRIRPVKVSIAAGTATITGHPSLLVPPALTTRVDQSVLDVTSAASYVIEVDVYQVFRDITATTSDPAQGTVMWEIGGCDTPPCNVEWLPVCLGARDAEQGMVGVDYSLGGTQIPPRNCEPDRVSVNYVAGYPTSQGNMDQQMADIVARLAAAWLPEGPCSCERSSAILNYWKEIPSKKDALLVTFKDMDDCPFGVTRGALWAWHRIRNRRNVEAVSA